MSWINTVEPEKESEIKKSEKQEGNKKAGYFLDSNDNGRKKKSLKSDNIKKINVGGGDQNRTDE